MVKRLFGKNCFFCEVGAEGRFRQSTLIIIKHRVIELHQGRRRRPPGDGHDARNNKSSDRVATGGKLVAR